MTFLILQVLIDLRQDQVRLEFSVCICFGHIPQQTGRSILLEHICTHDHNVGVITTCEQTTYCIGITGVV